MTAVDTEPLAWDPLNEKYKADPHAIWKRLRDEQPLYYNEQYDFYAVSRFADVDAFSRDPKTFISSHGTVMEMITADPDRHADDDLHGPARAHPLPAPRLQDLHAASHEAPRG